ncbi:hypothetical protein ACFXG4_51085, partial [Nocardia sp. NPDC059246]
SGNTGWGVPEIPDGGYRENRYISSKEEVHPKCTSSYLLVVDNEVGNSYPPPGDGLKNPGPGTDVPIPVTGDGADGVPATATDVSASATVTAKGTPVTEESGASATDDRSVSGGSEDYNPFSIQTFDGLAEEPTATDDQPVSEEPTAFRWIRKTNAPPLAVVNGYHWGPFDSPDVRLSREVLYVIEECDGLDTDQAGSKLRNFFQEYTLDYQTSLESGDLAEHVELVQE